jgi:pyruvate/2-oxoglutarate/acetoin dehydrogenase E1 component
MGGEGAEIAALVCEEAFATLKAPIRRVAALGTPIPFAPCLERAVLPDVERVVRAVEEIV